MKLQRDQQRGVQPSCNLAISCLPPDERKQVLKQIALHAIETPVTAGQKIAAVKELNLMEHIYDPKDYGRDIKIVFVIGQGYQGSGPYIDTEAKELPEEEGNER